MGYMLEGGGSNPSPGRKYSTDFPQDLDVHGEYGHLSRCAEQSEIKYCHPRASPSDRTRLESLKLSVKELKMNHLQFSGITKVPSPSVYIDPSIFIKASLLADENGLARLPQEKLHVTLIHQSVLKSLLKAEKKAQKKGEDSIIKYPTTQLRPVTIGTGSDVLIVEDWNPRTGESRRTVRIVLDDNHQSYLGRWVEEFCLLNDLERDEQELQRVYHVSFANLTGNPMDSVR